MGLEEIYCKPRTSIVDKAHRIYPYLLRDLDIAKPDQVWCADITYVPMARGNAYLCAVMDWHTRCVLGWSVSNTMEVGLCLSALHQAKEFAGCVPELFNTDQGSQFTGEEWTSTLKNWGVKISMDGREPGLESGAKCGNLGQFSNQDAARPTAEQDMLCFTISPVAKLIAALFLKETPSATPVRSSMCRSLTMPISPSSEILCLRLDLRGAVSLPSDGTAILEYFCKVRQGDASSRC
mgnify:CR=1 FL=1